MASSVEDTRIQLKVIGEQLSALSAETATSHTEPATPLLNAAFNAINSFDNDAVLSLHSLLHNIGELNNMIKDEKAQNILALARTSCINLLVKMYKQNQQTIDSLSGGPQKLKERYHEDFLQNKKQLARHYHQHEEHKSNGYLDNILQFVDFRSVLKRAEFLNALQAQTIKYYRQNQVADTSFNHAHLPELIQLETTQRLIHDTLMKEPTFDIAMLPASSQSYQFFLKEQVGRHNGIVIGNLSIGENSFEASRQWVMHINDVMKKPLQPYQFIDEMGKYTKKEQNRFEHMQPKISSEAIKDKSATSKEFKQLKTYNETFINDFLALLDSSYPPSAMVQFSDKKGHSHTIAIAKDERGIWMHDAKHYCVYFPNKELGSNEANEKFSAYFDDYYQRNYQQLTQVDLIHLAQIRPDENKKEKQEKQKHTREHKQKPLLLGPGSELGKQQPTYNVSRETPISPNPLKPTRGK